jgi:hypothetical protein
VTSRTVGYFEALLPILNILVPQTVQTPRVAALPFFIVISSVSFIVLDCLHFMQKPSIRLSSMFALS